MEKIKLRILKNPEKPPIKLRILKNPEPLEKTRKKDMKRQNLNMKIFKHQPAEVDWAGVDGDGMLHFGKAVNPHFDRLTQVWRGYEEIGKPIRSFFKLKTFIFKMGKTINNLKPNDYIAFGFNYNGGTPDEIVVSNITVINDDVCIVHFVHGYKSLSEVVKRKDILAIGTPKGRYKIQGWRGKFSIVEQHAENELVKKFISKIKE